MKLNKWIDPKFWEHPTPMNLLILIFGFVFFATLVSFIGLWFFHLVENHIPWPPRP